MSAAGPTARTGGVDIDEDRLEAALSARVRQVDARVHGAGGRYLEEAEEVRRAVSLVRPLRARLALGSFVGSVSTPSAGKPQLLLEFEASWSPVPLILKIYGKSRPGEAAVQQYWHRNGVSTPRILAFEDTPVSWLLMERVVGTSPVLEVGGASSQEPLHRAVATLTAKAHDHPFALPGERSLAVGVGKHLRLLRDVLASHGYAPPADLLSIATSLYGSGEPCTLHGDLTPANILRDLGGELVLIDTAAYFGNPAFDAARWCARVASLEPDAEQIQRALEQVSTIWLASEPRLDVEALRGLIGAELSMEAGVREIRKEEQGVPSDSVDEVTLGLLDLAARYLR